MTKESITVLYEEHDIQYEKCVLYSDFIQSLIMLIFDTYMGDDVTNKTEQLNHFKWCWDRTILDFKKEGIEFQGDELFHYFLDFIHEVYYKLAKKSESPSTYKNILKLWSFLFDYNVLKTNVDIDTFLEVYKLFQKSTKII